MLLTVTTTASDAMDLGHLLHKHPDRVHERDLGFGTARVFFPEAAAERCTAALAVDVDPITLVRGPAALAADGYVNDLPYVAGSLLSVALSRTFGSALAGRANECAARVEEIMPLEATLSAVHCPAGETLLQRAFGPLGYELNCRWHTLDDRFPDWGATVATVTLRKQSTVRELLRHLYILTPVVDGSKHYYVGLDEVEKLLRHGEGWLADHPDREWVVRRYLRYKESLARQALARLVADDAERDEEAQAEEGALEEPVRLNDQRREAVLALLRDPAAAIRSVVDLGCGEGRLLAELVRDARFERLLGVDVSFANLDRAERRLRLDRLPTHRRNAIGLVQGSLVYRDDRFCGFDAASLVEVIEHVDPSRLPSLERVVFGHAKPGRVIVTTPNAEYNVRWLSLPAGRFRHRDHRFEWTRGEFERWGQRVAERFGYGVQFDSIGPVDAEVGAPTQLAVFDRGVKA